MLVSGKVTRVSSRRERSRCHVFVVIVLDDVDYLVERFYLYYIQ
jgi:hypothetical protein